MRYIRFLKTPRLVEEKNSTKAHIYCLVTITSDLGDSFLPYDVVLSAELIKANRAEDIIVWRTVQWTGGIRTLAVTLPLSKSRAAWPVRIRIGVEPRLKKDHYHNISGEDSRGVVSAWSAPMDVSTGVRETIKFVERRIKLSDDREVRIWEETGESIARHLWDAGITLSCHIQELFSTLAGEGLSFARSTEVASSKRLEVLELGAGCGMVGLSIAQTIPDITVILTDLPEAEEIIQRNTSQASLAKNSTITFQILDWEEELPQSLQSTQPSLVVAADCTYNADSSPALVNTISRLMKQSPDLLVAIAMKMRHSSEEVFFELMSKAGFQSLKTIPFELPGDVEIGEEIVYLHIYRDNTQKSA